MFRLVFKMTIFNLKERIFLFLVINFIILKNCSEIFILCIAEDCMDERVLVAYATKYGATAEIAEKIAEVLKSKNVQAEAVEVRAVADLAPYRAIILGSGVYIGKWRKEAANFLKKHEKELTGKEVWLFSSGPTGEGDPQEVLKDWRFPKGLQQVADRIGPRDITVFKGAMDAAKMSGMEKWVIKKIKAPLGDFRDWDAVSAWAVSVADSLSS